MISRTTLATISCLSLALGVTIWQSGCGTSATTGSLNPSAVYTTEDSVVPAIRLTNLMTAGSPVLVGMGSKFTITWKAVSPPSAATVKLYLTTDNASFKASNSIEITPSGGIVATDGTYDFVPTSDMGLTTGTVSYYVVAQLAANQYVFDTSFSVQQMRIGDGGIIITYPASNITLANGLPINITWDITNNVCETLRDKAKVVQLYVDTKSTFDNNTAIEITPQGGIDACLKTFEFMTGMVKLTQGASYYIIGRLFIDGVEHSQGASAGTFTTIASLKATSPLQDIQNDLQTILVSWQVLGRSDLTGLKVEVLAEKSGVANDPDRVISGEFSADQGSGTADGSKLPPGTYNVVLRLYEYDKTSAKVTLDTATAPGKIIINNGYVGSYDLADMAAIATRNYSPVDGVIFTGFNINDQVGYDVAGVGDLNGDNFTDFLIFSRYGQEYTTGNAGSAYLIYGQNQYKNPIVNLNTVASPDPAGRQVSGTLMLFPMENLAAMDGPTIRGAYHAIGTPDISNDGKGDLMIGCPEAAPLRIRWHNLTTGALTVTSDQYGLPRAIPAGWNDTSTDVDPVTDEPCHVHEWLHFESPASPVVGYNLFFGVDYLPGDLIDIYVYAGHLDITVLPLHEKRGTTYLVTSERLGVYKDKVFDMAKIGSPVETDGIGPPMSPDNATAYDQMQVWMDAGIRFGYDISVLPDRDGDSRPEFIATAPEHTVVDTNSSAVPLPSRPQAGKARIFGSEYRWNDLAGTGAVGQIAWEFPGTWVTSSASGTYGNEPWVDIWGAQSGSRLSTAAGLGRFRLDNSTRGPASYTTGDFNGDNVPDVVVGCPGENNGAGSIYVLPLRPVLGHRATNIDLANFNVPINPGPDPSVNVPVLGLKIVGTVPGEQLGNIVKPVGDFNGDNLSDVMFSTPTATGSGRAEAGRVFLVFGQNIIDNCTLEDVDSHLGAKVPALIFEGQNAFDHLGARICAAYDVNGDGFDDILLAAPDAGAPGKLACGKVYLIYGKRNIIKTDPATGFKFVDYDGDNIPDDYWNVQDIGTKIPGCVFIGEAAGDHLQGISALGDVNGDGIGDFILGSPNATVSQVQQSAGKAYLVLGRKYVLP